jgi:hypothetical protein
MDVYAVHHESLHQYIQQTRKQDFNNTAKEKEKHCRHQECGENT